LIVVETPRATALSDLVDDEDRVLGSCLRDLCHGDPSRIHRAVHVLIFNRRGDVLLQKRAEDKQIQPGRWDSSVGGHLEAGEGYREAAMREMEEELCVSGVPLTFLYRSRIRNAVESENVETFLAHHDGPFVFPRSEISTVRFWSADEVDETLGRGVLTPNFEDEWRMLRDWSRRYASGQVSPPGLCAGAAFPDLLARLDRD